MRVAKLIAFTTLIYLNGCAGQPVSPQTNFAPVNSPAPKSSGLPSSVSADQFSWEVAPGAEPQTFRMTPTVQLAAAGNGTPPATPPSDEQVKKAAEQALPPGCKIEEIKTANGETQVRFTC